MKPFPSADDRGLYAIPPEELAGKALARAVAAALAGGAAWVQYRAKQRADVSTARALAEACRDSGARLIVNDDPRLAAASGADGVHLGRDDLSVQAAREILGPGRIIGASCYDDLARAEALAAEGVDYLAFGSVFASPTKPGATRCDPAVLAEARRFGKPIVAIGGITLDNAAQAIEAGADLVAVVSDLFSAADIRARAAAYRALFRAEGGPGASMP